MRKRTFGPRWLTAAAIGTAYILGGCGTAETTPTSSSTSTPPNQLTQIRLKTLNPIIGTRGTLRIEATAVFSDGTEQDANGNLEVSDTTGLQIIANESLLIGLQPGNYTLTYKQSGVSAATNVTVETPGATWRNRTGSLAVTGLSGLARTFTSGVPNSDGRLLAVSGASGDSVISDDGGLTWTKRSSSFSDGVNDTLPASVTAGGTDRFLVVKGRQAFFSDSKGESFARSPISALTAQTANAVGRQSFGGTNTFVAVGGSTPAAFTSTDGSFWREFSGTGVFPASANMVALATGPAAVAVGSDNLGPAIYTSTVGIAWGRATLPPNSASIIRAVAATNHPDIENDPRVIAAGDRGTIFVSLNGGLNWSVASSPDLTVDFRAIGVDNDNGTIVLGTTDGRIVRATSASPTPTAVESPPLLVGVSINAITYSNGRFCLVGTSPSGAGVCFTSP